jgi:hypothetical protein
MLLLVLCIVYCKILRRQRFADEVRRGVGLTGNNNLLRFRHLLDIGPKQIILLATLCKVVLHNWKLRR